MTIEAAIYDRATTHAGLSALVGNRVYPDLAELNVTDPWVTFHNVSGSSVEALADDTDINIDRFQIGAWSANKDTAILIREQIKAAFKRYKGTHAGIEIIDSHYITQIGSYDPTTLTHHIPVDFEIWYRTGA
jgi:hypothetical protein